MLFRSEECREADIIIAAIGRPDFVTADMVKEEGFRVVNFF